MHSEHKEFEKIKPGVLNQLVILEPIEIKRINSVYKTVKEFREKYPPHRLWQSFVDGRMYEPGPDGASKDPKGYRQFEDREPGCLKAYFRGFNCALKNIEDPSKRISIALIKAIHYEVSKDVTKLTLYNKPGNFRLESDTCSCTFRIEDYQITSNGLTDLLTKIENGELGETAALWAWYKGGDKLIIGYESIQKIKETLGYQNNQKLAEHIMESYKFCKYFAPTTDEIDDLIQSVIDNYNNKILSDEIQNDTDKVLQLIGETIQSLNRIHPFPDANGRTFANLLLNRMLLQNGFPPATFYDPNLLDVFTGNHVGVLKRAILNTLDVYEGKDIFGFNIDTQFSSEDIGFFKAMRELEKVYETPSIRVQANKPTKSSIPLPYFALSKKPKAKPGLKLKEDSKQRGFKKIK